MIVPLCIFVVSALILSLLLYMYNESSKEPTVPLGPRRVRRRRMHLGRRIFRQRLEPEFRGPPYKEYKPPRFQQMGVLTKDDGTILPLYGKQTHAHRDRYNYYTTTPGNQAFALPLSFQQRDCTEDLGCQEFFGKENVDVTGMGNFTVNKYNTKIFV